MRGLAHGREAAFAAALGNEMGEPQRRVDPCRCELGVAAIERRDIFLTGSLWRDPAHQIDRTHHRHDHVPLLPFCRS